MTARRLVAAVVTLGLAGALPARAQGASGAWPQVGLNIPHGFELDGDEQGYDPANNTLRIRVSVSGLPIGRRAREFAILLMGNLYPVSPSPVGLYTLQHDLWVGIPNPGVPVSLGTPYIGNYLTRHIIQKPVLVELLHKPTLQIVDRHRVIIIDRRSSGIRMRHRPRSIDASVGAQITGRGLDALEATHLSSLPYPTRAAFNDSLHAEAAGTTRNASLPTGFLSGTKACVPLNEAAPEFQALTGPAGLGPFATLQALMVAAYAAYQAVPNPLACVRTPAPYLASAFELCARDLSATMTDLDLAGVSDVDLSFLPASGAIGASVTTGRLDGSVTATLQNLFIRYTGGGALCIGRPRVNVSAAFVAADPARAAWATCSGLQADAASAATSLPLTFHVARGADSEDISVTGGDPADFTLSGKTTNTGGGTCAHAQLESHTEDLLERFHRPMLNALEDAWSAGSPTTHQAQALDALLSTLELGRRSLADLEFVAPVDTLETNETFFTTPGIREPIDGLVASWDTDPVQIVPSVVPTRWVFPPGFPASELAGFGPFDVSYTVSTGALNQLIRERYLRPDYLATDLHPTWNDLGVAPPGGARPEDPVPLDGTTLGAYVHPAFSELGATPIRIQLVPTIMPFTFTPDPDPWLLLPPGASPLTYQLGQLQVNFLTDDPVDPLFARVLVDMWDGKFQLDLVRGAPYLAASFGSGAEPRFLLEQLRSSTCQMGPVAVLQSPPQPVTWPTCGADLAAAVGRFVGPYVQERLLAMVSDFPAPPRFDASGAASSPAELEQIAKWTDVQMITFYTRLLFP